MPGMPKPRGRPRKKAHPHVERPGKARSPFRTGRHGGFPLYPSGFGSIGSTPLGIRDSEKQPDSSRACHLRQERGVPREAAPVGQDGVRTMRDGRRRRTQEGRRALGPAAPDYGAARRSTACGASSAPHLVSQSMSPTSFPRDSRPATPDCGSGRPGRLPVRASGAVLCGGPYGPPALTARAARAGRRRWAVRRSASPSRGWPPSSVQSFRRSRTSILPGRSPNP